MHHQLDYYFAFQINSGGFMVAFAGSKYAARSSPVFVGNSSYAITSFTLVCFTPSESPRTEQQSHSILLSICRCLNSTRARFKICIGRQVAVLHVQGSHRLCVSGSRAVPSKLPTAKARVALWTAA